MSDGHRADPMLASQADNSRTAQDILAYKIAEQCSALTSETDQKKKIREVVKDALIQFGQDEESVKNITAQFNPEMSVQEYRSTYINSHLIQATALIDSNVFHSFKTESLLPINRNKKTHTMQMTAQYFTLVLRKYMAMFDDTVRERYLQNVRIFSERIGRALAIPFEQTLYKTLGHDGCRTLRSIQKTCNFLASEILESEKTPKRMSLEEYSRRPVYKSFRVTSKNLGKMTKVLESSKETIDLVKNPDQFDLFFNCFKCISAVPDFKPSGSEANPIRPDSPTTELDLRPPLRFVDQTKAAFNVYKALPLQSRREAEEHLGSVHSVVDPKRLAGSSLTCEGHTTLIFCDLCTASSAKIVFSATCCLVHRIDHCRLLHSKDKIHFALLKSFKREFTEDTALLRLAETHLESQCVFCWCLLESKQERDRHHITCIIRFSLLCMWYGEPMRTTRAFRSAHSEQAIKDSEMAHAVRAVKKILDSISDTNESRSEQPIITTAKSEVMGFCSSIILNSTKDDFLHEENCSSSSTTTNSDDDSQDERKSGKRKAKRKLRRKKKKAEARAREERERESQRKKETKNEKKRKKEEKKTKKDRHTDKSSDESSDKSTDKSKSDDDSFLRSFSSFL